MIRSRLYGTRTNKVLNRWPFLAVGLAGLFGWSAVATYNNTRQVYDSANWVAHTHEVMVGLESVSAELTSAETGCRGYVGTGRPAYVDLYETSVPNIHRKLDEVEILTSDNPRQQEAFPALREKIADRVGVLESAVSARRAGNQPAALKVLADDQEMNLSRDVQSLLRRMTDHEQDLLRDRNVVSAASYRFALFLNVLVPVAAIGCVGAFVYLLRKHLAAKAVAFYQITEQSERLRITLSSIGDAVVTTDAGGLVTNLNPVAEHLTGWSDADAKGVPLETVFRIINETTRLTVESPSTRALREGVIVGLANHTLLIAKDGTERPIDDSAAPIKYKGETVGCILVFRDISDRKSSEFSLRDSEATKAAILRTALDCIITIDASGAVQDFNPAAERTFGYSRDEVLGREMAEFVVPPDLRDAHRKGIARYLQSGEGPVLNKRLELVAVRKGGEQFPVEVAITPILCQGKPLFTGHLRDITERKQVEQKLRESEAQFRHMADAMPQVVWTARPDGHVDYYNERWYEYTGFARDEYSEEYWVAVLHPEDVERTKETYAEAIRAATPYRIEYRWKDRSTGGFRWFLGQALPVKDAAGNVIRWFGTCTDIDVTKKAQEQLRELAAELSDADRRKDEFLSLLAHELRNPLAPLRNGLQIMSMTTDGRAVEQARSMMERQLGNMVRLVDDLLDVSRISRGKLELRPEPIDLMAAIAGALETSRPVIDAARHVVEVVTPPGPLPVSADLVRLSQVFSNLLNNAAKYTEPGGRIWITITRESGGVLRTGVKDTGIGVPANMLVKIFDMFTQVDRSLEKSQGGLGIGLTLVKRLTEMHGGSVEVLSEGEGKGSEFVVRLPEIVTAQAVQPQHAGDSQSGRLKILVTDDNVDAAASLGDILGMLGHKVWVAHDGLQAVEAAGRHRPDVLLLDIGMPNLNGYETCKRIRATDWGGKLVIIALTGWGHDEDRRRSQEAGFDYHMVKPVDLNALKRLLAGQMT